MKRLAVFALVAFMLAVPACQAQFLKKLGQELLQGNSAMPGQNGGGLAGTPAGSTNLPPGQYMMTNMNTGQGFYIMVDNQGQMYASQPQAGQTMPGQFGAGAVMPGQQTMPGQFGAGQQQQQGGVGGFMKNLLKDQLMPGQNQQGMPMQQQQY